MGNRMFIVHVTDDMMWPRKVKVMTQYARTQYFEISWWCYLATLL